MDEWVMAAGAALLSGAGVYLWQRRERVTVLEGRMDAHEEHCRDRHNRINSRLHSIEEKLDGQSRVLARLEGALGKDKP